LSEVEVEAMNIIRGEMSGDKFLWTFEWFTPEGEPQVGCWKSYAEDKGFIAKEQG